MPSICFKRDKLPSVEFLALHKGASAEEIEDDIKKPSYPRIS